MEGIVVVTIGASLVLVEVPSPPKPDARNFNLISQNLRIKWFEKVKFPSKRSTYCILLLGGVALPSHPTLRTQNPKLQPPHCISALPLYAPPHKT